MELQTLTFIVVGITFAIYIGIAFWARAGSTSEFYIAGGGIHPVANGMATAADWMSAASFLGMAAIMYGTVKAGHVVVIRYEGPKGGPGMREMLSPTGAIMGKGLGSDVALITVFCAQSEMWQPMPKKTKGLPVLLICPRSRLFVWVSGTSWRPSASQYSDASTQMLAWPW